jgi:hypothetical protein
VKAASRSSDRFESSGSLLAQGQPDALRSRDPVAPLSREPSVAETN